MTMRDQHGRNGGSVLLLWLRLGLWLLCLLSFCPCMAVTKASCKDHHPWTDSKLSGERCCDSWLDEISAPTYPTVSEESWVSHANFAYPRAQVTCWIFDKF